MTSGHETFPFPLEVFLLFLLFVNFLRGATARLRQTFDDHTFALGMVIVNLLGLEVLMGLYLQDKDSLEFDLRRVMAGDSVQESPLTNYDTLRQVLEKYKKAVKSQFHVDKLVVDLRGAFAHGRILSFERRLPLRLFMFGKATRSNRVPIQQVYTVDHEWLEEQERLIEQKEPTIRSHRNLREGVSNGGS